MEQLRSCSWEQFEHSWRMYVGKTRSVGLRIRWLTGNVEGGSHLSVYANCSFKGAKGHAVTRAGGKDLRCWDWAELVGDRDHSNLVGSVLLLGQRVAQSAALIGDCVI